MAKTSQKRQKPVSCLGPVADLESHLPPEWWRDLFRSLYLRTDGDVVENDTNTVREVDLLIQSTGIEPDDRILDLCCGQGRHVLELARRGFQNVVGVDRSRYLIRLARRRAAKLGLKVAFHEGDARSFRPREAGFGCVAIMGNSFGYFATEDDDLKVLETIKKLTRPGAVLALDITDGQWIRGNFDPRSWEWIDQNHFVCRERSLTGDGDRLVSREVVVHAERGVIADQFYAERLYSHERIVSLLEKAGFRHVRLNDTLSADSERGQDLGMMAHRLFITAAMPPQPAARIGTRKLVTDVAVVMGDPRLPDAVKKGGRFNVEDLDTIERLKTALAGLPGYRFRYLDNHATLLGDLRTQRPDLVFNLCDEGFNNEATQELHVPALLEMLGVPYTGAGPACLAHCYDKSLVRAMAAAIDVPVPVETFIRADDQSATIPSVFPAILKPNTGDSSIGITKDAIVYTPQELVAYFTQLRETLPGRSILVQEYLTGPEYSVALVGNMGQDLQPLPILEVDYSHLDAGLPRILGYESKWLPDSPYWSQIKYVETKCDPDQQRAMVEYSMTLFERLQCRDYARFDFRADAEGNVKLLEVNPNPGWCWDGKFNLMAEFAGLSYSNLLGQILDAAQSRYAAGSEERVAIAV